MSNTLVNTIVALVTLAGLAWILYRPRVQQSDTYQATVVPLANIMDVGFIVLSPIIVVLVGFDAPLFMLGLCLVAIVTGFAISYNIRHYEPLVGTPDRVHSIDTGAKWALLGASVVNIGYYAMLLMSLVLLPLNLYSAEAATGTGIVVLVIIGLVGMAGKLGLLNNLGDKTTAFNLAALFAILIALVFYNFQEALGGRWEFPTYNPPNDADNIRKLLGFFAMVQGFEASRYLGARFAGELRIATMRLAQYVSTVVFVVLIASILILFVQFDVEADATAIFKVAEAVSPFLPFLILLAAVGSQLSAITNAISSRSELLLEITHNKIDQRWTFPIVVIPAILVVLFTDVTASVALASRVFALYFLIQALLAGILAARSKSWWMVALFAVIGIAMAIIAIFGIAV